MLSLPLVAPLTQFARSWLSHSLMSMIRLIPEFAWYVIIIRARDVVHPIFYTLGDRGSIWGHNGNPPPPSISLGPLEWSLNPLIYKKSLALITENYHANFGVNRMNSYGTRTASIFFFKNSFFPCSWPIHNRDKKLQLEYMFIS